MRPSGETSSDIHVPSLVVNLRARVGMRGSSEFGAVARRALSGGVCACTARMFAARNVAISARRTNGDLNIDTPVRGLRLNYWPNTLVASLLEARLEMGSRKAIPERAQLPAPNLMARLLQASTQSVCGKSSPTHSNGSPATTAVAYARQSPKLRPAG